MDGTYFRVSRICPIGTFQVVISGSFTLSGASLIITSPFSNPLPTFPYGTFTDLETVIDDLGTRILQGYGTGAITDERLGTSSVVSRLLTESSALLVSQSELDRIRAVIWLPVSKWGIGICDVSRSRPHVPPRT